MSNTLTFRVPDELAEWLSDAARRTGVPVSQIIREQLEKAREEDGNQRFLRHAGAINGPADLSSRKGFSRR
jgi:predicted DNA-binding protein